MTDAITPADEVDGSDGPTPPDYSRLSFRELQRLCKSPDRNLSGEGKTIDLINRLREWDAQHGREIDLSALDVPDDDEVDLLADDEPPAAPQRPSDGGAVASPTPPSGGPKMAGAGPTVNVPVAQPAGPATTPAAPSPAAPAMHMAAVKPTLRRGQVDLTVRNGAVQDADGRVKAFRAEFPCPPGELSDVQHRLFIADAHGVAQQAGYTTKGGVTIGTRVGYAADADGRRTVVYEVMLRA